MGQKMRRSQNISGISDLKSIEIEVRNAADKGPEKIIARISNDPRVDFKHLCPTQ